MFYREESICINKRHFTIVRKEDSMYNFYYLDMFVRKNPDKVRFYKYRTATPKTVIMRFDSNENEDVKYLEEALYDVTKATPDNHVLFSIELEDCCTLAIEFSDYKATFGIGVKKGRW